MNTNIDKLAITAPDTSVSVPSATSTTVTTTTTTTPTTSATSATSASVASKSTKSKSYKSEKKTAKKLLIWSLIIFCILLCIGIGIVIYFAITNSNSNSNSNTTATAPPLPPLPRDLPPSSPFGVSSASSQPPATPTVAEKLIEQQIEANKNFQAQQTANQAQAFKYQQDTATTQNTQSNTFWQNQQKIVVTSPTAVTAVTAPISPTSPTSPTL